MNRDTQKVEREGEPNESLHPADHHSAGKPMNDDEGGNE